MADSTSTRRQLGGNGIAIAERPVLACVNLRGNGRDSKFIRAVAGVIDLQLPVEPTTSVAGLFAAALWLGPDEWLITSETQSAEALSVSLRKSVHGLHAAVTEVGDGRVVFSISGSNACTVLAKGCSIDFHPRAYRPGQCVQTLLAKLSVLIHQRSADPVYDVFVARSFSDYAWAWFEAAASEFL